MNTKKLTILLIEDDAIEVMKLQRTIKSLSLDHTVAVANDGEEALGYLQNDEVHPDIILLDLNMPKLNGVEFLSILKNDENLKYLPTIMLTTSSNPKDLKECYRLGIAGYVIKPLQYDDYVSKIKLLLEYWAINELIKF